mmetsp:Transcript_21229/g.58994  ORF Transcript_21229/g.58994 Transcript_21229/m.58994 type:complete len:240 (+) Transcript_21229:1834-2553(+)
MWEPSRRRLSTVITALRAGMLIPAARVSVANTALSSPLWKAASTSFFHEGSRPAWCAATPRRRPVTASARTASGCEARNSSRSSRMAARWVSLMRDRELLSHTAFTALSQSRRLKMKKMAGSMSRLWSCARASCIDNAPSCSFLRPVLPLELPLWLFHPSRCSVSFTALLISRLKFFPLPSSRGTTLEVLPSSLLAKTQSRGIGRNLVTTVVQGPCTVSIHPPRSWGFFTVADMHSIWM